MPTRKTAFWLLAAVVLYLISWNVGSGWLNILTAAMVGAALASPALGLLNTAGVSASLSAPATAVQGDNLTATVQLVNRPRLPRFSLRLQGSWGGASSSLLVPYMGCRKTGVEMTFPGVRRGIYSGGALTISSGAPFGLFRSRRRLRMPGPLVVYPQWRRLALDWQEGQRNAGYLAAAAAPVRNPASDYLGVRDYRPQDSPRSIHWRTTARSGRLAVVEYSRQSAVTPVILVDCFREARAGRGSRLRFETALSIAASLVQREVEHNRRFGLGSSIDEAAEMGLSHAAQPAMLWLAAAASGDRPLDLNSRPLPWPQVTPVLILSSHRAYRRLPDSVLAREFPHLLVIMLDANGFDAGAFPDFMSREEIDDLAEGVEGGGGRFLLIPSPEAVESCLRSL